MQVQNMAKAIQTSIDWWTNSLSNKVPTDNITRFKQILILKIYDEIARDGFSRLFTDNYPEGILAEAAQDSSIHGSFFQPKVSMFVSPSEVSMRKNFDTNQTTLFSTATSQTDSLDRLAD